MATAERPLVASAEDRAWDFFFEALDADSDATSNVPPGAAILAADAPDCDELVRRYHADKRTVVIVHADGRREVMRPRSPELIVLLGLALLGVWIRWRNAQHASA